MATLYEAIQFQSTEDIDLAEQLRAEKNVLSHKVRQEGFELGIRSSSQLSQQEFAHFERVRPLAVSFDEDVLDYLWTFLDTKGYPEQARLHDTDFIHLLEVDPQFRIIFAQGWLEGVISVWHTIKDQVDTDQIREEKDEVCAKVHQVGFDLGIHSSPKLSYIDFTHFERVQALVNSLDEDVLDYLWTFLDMKGYPQESRLPDADFADLLAADGQYRILFAQGWVEGVLSVWAKLQTQVAQV